MKLYINRKVITGPGKMEVVLNNPAFPVVFHYNDFGKYIKEAQWHWHFGIEISYVIKGELDMDVGYGREYVRKGEGLFINSDVLHTMYSATSDHCALLTIVFDPRFVAGDDRSLLECKYVQPLLHHKNARRLIFRRDGGWHSDVLRSMMEAYFAYFEGGFFSEMKIRNELANIVSVIAAQLEGEMPDRAELADDSRVKAMLTFIEQHYDRQVTLEEIAASASVSISECCRCFKKSLGTTPFSYLKGVRITMAAQLLESTDKPVTEICFATGFQGISYFGKQFREATGLSPREYRRKNRRVESK